MALRIENAVDLHCHFGPDSPGGSAKLSSFYTGVPAIECARDALEEGYAAIVLKPHGFASPSLGRMLEPTVPGLHVFGGICTDHATGGFNAYAVELALSLGAKIVWLPTVHSVVDFDRYRMDARHRPLGPLRVLDDEDRVVSRVHEIFELAREAGAIVGTGHISAEEHYAVVRAYGRTTRIVVTHAGDHRAGPCLTPAQCRELADLGASVELTALCCRDVGDRGRPVADTVDFIHTVGVPRCTLGSDYGWNDSFIPRPVPGMREFLESLWHEGISEEELATMASLNPGRLLELPFC